MIKLFIAACIWIFLFGCVETEKKDGESMSNILFSQYDSGYKSTVSDWYSFLDCWNNEIYKSLSEKNAIVAEEQWNSQKSQAQRNFIANEAILSELEIKFEKILPKSYKDFVLATGGSFKFTSDYLNDIDSKTGFTSLYSVKTIEVYKQRSPEMWKMWSEHAINDDQIEEYPPYYSLDMKGNLIPPKPLFYLLDDLVKTVEIGQISSARADILLNPNQISSDGEWEVWVASGIAGGMERYRSFSEMMQNYYYDDTQLTDSVPPYESSQLLNSCAKHIKSQL